MKLLQHYCAPLSILISNTFDLLYLKGAISNNFTLKTKLSTEWIYSSFDIMMSEIDTEVSMLTS